MMFCDNYVESVQDISLGTVFLRPINQAHGSPSHSVTSVYLFVGIFRGHDFFFLGGGGARTLE